MAPKTWAHLAWTWCPTVCSAPARPPIAVTRPIQAERTKQRTVSSHVASRASCARSNTPSRWSVPFTSFHAVAPSVHLPFHHKKNRVFFSRASQQGRFRRRRARPPASPAPSMRALASRATSTCASLDVHPSWPGPKRACGRHQAPFFAVSTRTHQRLALVPTLHAVFDDDARVAHLQKRACACDDAASEVFVRVNRTCDSCCETMDEDEMKRTQACTGNVRDPPPGISKCE